MASCIVLTEGLTWIPLPSPSLQLTNSWLSLISEFGDGKFYAGGEAVSLTMKAKFSASHDNTKDGALRTAEPLPRPRLI